jgi:hypothetical protein
MRHGDNLRPAKPRALPMKRREVHPHSEPSNRACARLLLASFAVVCASFMGIAPSSAQNERLAVAATSAQAAGSLVPHANRRAGSTRRTDRFVAQRKTAARQFAQNETPATPAAPYAPSYAPAAAPLTANPNVPRAGSFRLNAAQSNTRDAFAASNRIVAPSSVIVAPTSIDAKVIANLHEPLTAPAIEMGDRPARGTSLCGDGRVRRFGDIDVRAFAQALPDFNVVRPRTVCVRRGVLMADYGFK